MRGRLGRNVVVGTSTAAIFIGTALLSVPLIVDAVGTAGYGVWTIAQSLILFVAVADGGLGTGLLRFAAVAHGAGRRDGVAQVAWTVMAIYLAIGVVVAAALLAAAPDIIGLFDIPDGLTEDAVDTFRLAGLVFVLALVAAGFGNLQQGLERWVPFAVSASLASVAFIAALVALLPDAGLEGVAWAAVAQQGTLVLVRGWNVRDVFLARRPELLGRAEARQVVAFSAQMQMSAVATFANNQSDKVVVGLVAPVTTVGQLGIGAQVAEAGRLVAGTAINPLVSRMSIVFGEGGREALTGLYLRLERLWTLTVIGATAIGGATLLPLIRAWLGDGHDEAALLGGFLVLAFGINLLTGVPTAFLRAIGQPGLEARYGLMVIGVNVLFTVALGVLFGARGVVLGTACAYLVATVWFFIRFRRLSPPRPPGWLGNRARLAAALVACSAAALGWGLAMTALLPAGVALLPVGLGIAVAWVAFMAATTGVRPTLANARSLVA